MKIATLPPIRVAPDLRQELEDVLEPGETLSQFVESVVERRKHQSAFVSRGIAAIEETQRSGHGIPAEQVVVRLEAKLQAARQAQARRG